MFQAQLQLSPGAIRAHQADTPADTCTLTLHYRPPYQWQTLLDFYRARCLAGIEKIDDRSYSRTFALPGCQGWYEVSQHPERHALLVRINCSNLANLQQVVNMIRQQFDLNANPDLIQTALQTDPVLGRLVMARPGLRLPGIISEFEALIRAIAGQQVSVAAARTLLRRLSERCGTTLSLAGSDELPALLFPNPQQILDNSLEGLGFTGKRQAWMQQIAARYAAGFSARHTELDESVALLQTLPGIGAWSAHYIAMRAFGEPDAFPIGDLGLLNALKNPQRPAIRELSAMAEAWRPWRAYATFYLWNSLS